MCHAQVVSFLTSVVFVCRLLSSPSNLQAAGTKSDEFISMCVISEPLTQNFILRKIHHLGM